MGSYMSSAFEKLGLKVHHTFVPYEEYGKRTQELKQAQLIIVSLSFGELYPNIINDVVTERVTCDEMLKNATLECKKILSVVKSNTDAKIIWAGFDDYLINVETVYGNTPPLSGLVDRINQSIIDILTDDVYVDIKRLIARIGINQAYSIKGKYRWNALYSKDFIKLLSDEVFKQYLIYAGITKKCLILDCDNVLWGGVVSEDGIEGIHLGRDGLGREFQDFQRFLQNLYYHGVILAVCSKNDEEDVLRVFREHSGMILKEEQIACFQVNWDSKATNIRAIAEELNIGTESMVFVNDSEFEIEAVKSFLPEVITILYDRERMYEKFSCFNLKSEINLEDIEQRNNTYRTNRSRKALMDSCNSYDKYVELLSNNIEIHRILPMEYSRVAELTQRTNKCTNGKRYTVAELKKRLRNPEAHLYSVSLSDRFSDMGIVGAMEIENGELGLFSLSCRALGRNVENKMLEFITKKYTLKSILFKQSDRNKQLLMLMQESIPDAEFLKL